MQFSPLLGLLLGLGLVACRTSTAPRDSAQPAFPAAGTSASNAPASHEETPAQPGTNSKATSNAPAEASAVAPHPSPHLAPSSKPGARPRELEPVLDSSLAGVFSAEGMTGAVALYEVNRGAPDAQDRFVCSDLERCRRGYLPASTFKIANSLIGLETRVLESAETVLPWDGAEYTVEAWNRDNTLRSAIAVSCVPCYQRIARGVGEMRMKEWLERLDYGNHRSTPRLEWFWLEGDLRITPLQQIDFLWRLREAKLPVSQHSRDVVLDILALSQTNGAVLRAKTGLASASIVGWFVGFVEAPDRTIYFATMIDGAGVPAEIAPARKRITSRVLREWAQVDIPAE